jgi:GTP cyclohydrolase I
LPKRVKEIKQKAAEAAIKLLLEALGYDLKNPDIRDTPKRVARMFINELNPNTDMKKLFSTFPSTYGSLVALLNHKAFTRCPHHLEKVEMDISIAYIPENRLIGLSKPFRIADYISKGLMLQEEVAECIAEGLMIALKPKGVAVFVKGNHMCMRSRGVESTHSTVITTRLLGIFLEDIKAREEFYHILKIGGN